MLRSCALLRSSQRLLATATSRRLSAESGTRSCLLQLRYRQELGCFFSFYSVASANFFTRYAGHLHQGQGIIPATDKLSVRRAKTFRARSIASLRVHRRSLHLLQQFQQRLKASLGKDFIQPAFHLAQPRVMANVRLPPCLQPRLFRVKLPGMEVHHDRAALAPMNAANGPAREAHGQQTEITSPHRRKVLPCHLYRGGWKFPNSPS